MIPPVVLWDLFPHPLPPMVRHQRILLACAAQGPADCQFPIHCLCRRPNAMGKINGDEEHGNGLRLTKMLTGK
jgi:hypothetical protein